MRKLTIYVLLMLFIPWLSIPLLGRSSFKRYLPGTIFMSVYVTLEGYLAEKKKWWWFPYPIKPNVLAEMPLILGPFFVGSLWTLKLTFGNFKKYLLLNVIIDTFFTYFMMNWFKRIGYVSLIRINKFQLSLLFLLKSILMYGYQYFHELVFARKSN
ncbi:hypothetical protein JOC77_003734 [Peribacillus deserti]|uniref:Uncharacterized protein n=1 Tax=Peribacillus deserti TaxID=673318 RepID=A0ABS2QM82_9BACI|nr:hypothetical protein [Peribacillus deserti]MBM7694273.1 hypothetical protein [Peribacillus deserti]